jgi:hypothetical protein
LDGVSRDQVDQEENEGDDEPDHWQGVEDALEEGLQESVRCFVILSAASAKAVAEIGSAGERLDASDEGARRVGILRLRAG